MDAGVRPCDSLLMNDTDMTEAEWNSLSEREKQHILEAHRDEYLAECSPEQRARIEWMES